MSSDDVMREVASLLFGEGSELVYKMNPTQNDIAAHKKDRRERAITAGLSAVGGTAGSAGAIYAGKGLLHEVRPPIPRKHRGLPKHHFPKLKGWKAPAAVLGLEAVGLGGEIMSTKILGNDVRRQRKAKLQPIQKSIDEIVETAQIPTKRSVTRAVVPKAKSKGAEYVKKSGVLRKLPAKVVTTNEVGKRGDDLVDVTWSGEIAKANEDKQQVFGWASVVEVDGQPVVDLQGDYISPEEMEKAAYTYVMKSRKGGDMHLRDNWEPIQKSEMIESFIVTDEKKQAMGLPSTVPTGWWVGFQVQDPELWSDVKIGKRTGFSIHGRGRRNPL